MRPLRWAAAVGIAGLLVLATGVPAVADPIRDGEWQLGYLHIDQVQAITIGEGVTVGLIDTGVDATHPDLAGSVLPGTDFTVAKTDGRVDEYGHGTQMAGLIAGHGRVLGIAPAAKILPVRNSLAKGIPVQTDDWVTWAVDHGATVLCLAYNEPADQTSKAGIAYAIAHDVVVVAAMGNDPTDTQDAYPAAYPGVVAVAGIDQNGNHADFSVTGDYVTLAAPAVGVVTTDITGGDRTGYFKGTGTSAATAIVAGAAALVRARFPDLSAAEVIHRLTATADDEGAPGHDSEYGYGVVDILAALTAEVAPLPTASQTPSLISTSSATAIAPVTSDHHATTVFAIIVVVAVVLVSVVVALVALRSRRSRSG